MTKQEFLAISLPYGLHCSFLYDNEYIQGSIIVGMEFTVDGEFSSEKPLAFIDEFGEYRFDIIKPILHPLSDLTKWIEHKGEKIIPLLELKWNRTINGFTKSNIEAAMSTLSFKDALKLIEWHFDLFGGIDNGEAIDVNTLTENPYK